MKRKKIVVSFSIGILCCLIVMCFVYSRVMSSQLPPGLYYEVEGLPEIDSFSGEKYEDHKWQFSPVISAVLKHNGKEENIDPNDPRLIKLLNFISYGYSELLSPWQQSHVKEDEIKQYLACKDPMLEVTFEGVRGSEPKPLYDTPRIVICGDSILAFVDTETPTSWYYGRGLLAERIWPYGSLILKLCESHPYDALISDDWGTGYWIDLLEYSGIIKSSRR